MPPRENNNDTPYLDYRLESLEEHIKGLTREVHLLSISVAELKVRYGFVSAVGALVGSIITGVVILAFKLAAQR